MLRRFFYNARTRGPSLARDIILLVKPDHLGSGPRGLWVFRDLCRKRGRPRQRTFGERGPPGTAARSFSHTIRYAAIRSDKVR